MLQNMSKLSNLKNTMLALIQKPFCDYLKRKKHCNFKPNMKRFMSWQSFVWFY